MPKVKFPGPCSQCGKVQEYYKKELCDNCYRKAKRRERGLKPTAVRTQLGPCSVCNSATSSNGRFIRGMCSACYRRIFVRGSTIKPRTKFSGPCEKCGISDPLLKYNYKLCPKCFAWYCNNVRLANAYNRARKAGVVTELTDAQWLKVLKHFKYRCAYCGKDIWNKYTVDHVIPISKGGTHAIDNVVPCCLSCNGKKGNGPPLRPVVTLKE